MIVQTGLLVEKLSYEIRRCQDNSCRRSNLEGEDAAILLGPITKSSDVVSFGSE